MDVTPELLAKFLGQTALFRDFSPDEIAVFVPLFRVERVDAGRCIFEERSLGDAWYIVIAGEVMVSKSMDPGPPHVLAHLEAGDCFGEMALIDDAPRMASIDTITSAVLAWLPRTEFVRLMHEGNIAATKLSNAICSVLCKRQRQLTAILLDLIEVPTWEESSEMHALTNALRDHVTWN